MLEQQVLGLI